MSDDKLWTTASGRSLRAATSAAKDLSAEVFPNASESYPCEGASKSGKPDNDDGPQEGLGELVHEKTLHVEAHEKKFCYWCHEPLPPLPDDASYVDEINHYIHDECRQKRDDNNRRMEQLRAGFVERSIDSIPNVVHRAVLDRIQASGFSRRCPCLTTLTMVFTATRRTRSEMTMKSMTTTSATVSTVASCATWGLASSSDETSSDEEEQSA